LVTLQMVVEGGEAIRPEMAIGRQPGLQLLQSLRLKAIKPPLTVGADGHEAGLAQELQVLGDAGLAEGEGRDEISCRPLTGPKDVQDGPAAGLCHGFERRHDEIYTPIEIYRQQNIGETLPLGIVRKSRCNWLR
jgi:hypothetical protein